MKKVLLTLLLAAFAFPFAMQAQQNGQYEVVVDEISNCGPYTWTLGNGQTYDNDTVVTYFVGDTLRVLTLTVNPTFSIELDPVSAMCEYEWNGHKFTEAGTYIDTMKTAQGCDSIVSLTITEFSHTMFDTIDTVTCGMFVWNHGEVADSVFESGILSDVVVEDGCTINKTINLTVRSATVVDSIVACGMYQWHGNAYFETVNDTVAVHDSVTLCDSVYVLNLQVVRKEVMDTVVNCGKYQWRNQSLTISDDYVDTAYSDTMSYVSGTDTVAYTCDTIFHLNLVVDTNVNVAADTVCYKYVWKHGYVTDTLYESAVRTEYNTDTVSLCVTRYDLNLTVIPLDVEGHDSDTTMSKCATITFTPFGERSRRYTATEDIDTNFVKEIRTVKQCYDTTIHAHFIVRTGSTVVNMDTVVCDSYTWPVNEQTYTTSGKYEYRLPDTTNAQGCDSTVVLKLVVNVSPVINAINGNYEVTPGESATLSADVSQNVTYKWEYGNQTATTPEITINNVTENIDVTLTVTNNKHCSDTNWVTVMPLVSIEDVQADNISLYPNPTVAIVNIDCQEAISNITLYNTVGQQVIALNDLGNKTTLDLSSVAQGNYTLRVVLANGEVIVRKVVVTR